jgi:hypothetical protein
VKPHHPDAVGVRIPVVSLVVVHALQHDPALCDVSGLFTVMQIESPRPRCSSSQAFQSHGRASGKSRPPSRQLRHAIVLASWHIVLLIHRLEESGLGASGTSIKVHPLRSLRVFWQAPVALRGDQVLAGARLPAVLWC